MNVKAERHIQTIENMLLSGFYDSGLPHNLWFYNMDYQAVIYNSLIHTATLEQPDF